ncbi:MAG: type IIL restriction-modification enzyme MmeI [Ferruginibacter sp.]
MAVLFGSLPVEQSRYSFSIMIYIYNPYQTTHALKLERNKKPCRLLCQRMGRSRCQTFFDAFFDVFGISRRKIGNFEHRVKKLNDADGYIDLLWKGNTLVEIKSRGKDLDKAFTQAKDYAQNLPQHELPKYILLCDFNIFRLYDTEEQSTHQFVLKDLVKNVQLFGQLIGYRKTQLKEQYPANIDAAAIGKSPPGIKQSCRPLLPPPTLYQRNQTHRIFI